MRRGELVSLRAASLPLPVPGLLLGAYPERPAPPADRWQSLLGQCRAALALPQRLGGSRVRAFVARVGSLDARTMALDGVQLRAQVQELRARMAHRGLHDDLTAEAFALIRVTAQRVLGQRAYDSQLSAARVMLDNRLAEMATGEGKTLAAAVCAATAALAGIPVHVVTANDYLVARDAESLRPLYEALGLSVGYVVAAHDPPARRAAYACDITYCSAKELVFDYLRDRVARAPDAQGLQAIAAGLGASEPAPGAPLLRGLCMSIVDEADSILIDEARVPLILARSAGNRGESDYYGTALELAHAMRRGEHFVCDPAARSVALREAGLQRLESQSADLSGIWLNRSHREETVTAALCALHLYQRDRDYLVHNGAIVIVDESTGRLAPGRVWSRGLHQLVERKEGCEPTGEQVTAAQITYQRFFARYLRLCGMSGTLMEARGELAAVYGLDVVKVALRRPSQRIVLPTRLLRDRQLQWQQVAEQTRQACGAGRAVLIGTDSVADSEGLSAVLAHAGVAHQVLNARHDLREALIVGNAGRSGAVTVATNMAGRGTDIELGEGVAERGGLHVISCQHNNARRIDRQLIGRCGRQGDPGSVQTLVALDKPLIRRLIPAWIAAMLGDTALSRPRWLVQLTVRLPQMMEERRQRRQRRDLQRMDERAENELFVGMRGD